MVKERRKITLLLDNSPTHPKGINSKLKNVSFLLASKHHIKTAGNGSRGDKKKIKLYYRKRILRKVITAHENNQSMPNINLRESISKAWNYDVTDRTIHNSFAKAGFFVFSESTEDEDDIPLEEMRKILAKGKTRNYGFYVV
ncbi:tigger transposable element-derived protein 4 [Nephila pilipes]|uniref:Tigger transposable element-derived protein 4 n=1 Tax=Nephila pilipes TaxID=299642 RepID=A0A8X6MP19_NEPPI|nr:tigger transposable element-derived protein 4 [Nephila pilipes]